jgi:diadenosine tetraphosphate (Ap4A) HIT family hydrolase
MVCPCTTGSSGPSLLPHETVKELMAAAVAEEKGFRPGVVSVVQTFGERANFHAHVHALASRGGWMASGGVDPGALPG